VNVSDFDFDLPESLIAQGRAARGAAHGRRDTGTWEEGSIADLPALLTRAISWC
jgi:hypothetical protein